MGERPAGKTLDRIDGSKGYELSNCRWATPLDQMHNRRDSKLTLDDAVEIIIRCKMREPHINIAKRFNVTAHTITDINGGRRWRNAKPIAERYWNKYGDKK